MANRTKSKKYKTRELPWFRIILLMLLCSTLFYPPFFRGLFFEGEQLFTELIILLLFSVFWIYKILKGDRRFLVTPLDFASLGLIIVYFISIFVAVGTHLAIQEWLKYCMYFAVFLMLSDLAYTYRSKLAVLWTIMASGLGVCIIGIDSMAGMRIVNILNKFFKSIGLTTKLGLDEMFFELSTGGRLSSTIQYPNTFAVYLIALFVVSIGLIIASEKLWVKMLGGALGCIFLISFILTLSRGAFIILPIVLVIYFIMLPTGNRIKGITYIFVVGVCSAFAYFKVWGYVGLPDDSVSVIWIYSLIAAVLSAFLVLIVSFIIKWLESINWKVYIAALGIVTITGIVMGVYLLNAAEPLELKHDIIEAEGGKAVQKSVVLEPGQKYELELDVSAEMQVDKPYTYSIDITSRSIKNILFGSATQLLRFEGKETNGIENKRLEFEVPQDSEIVDIRFTNVYQGTKAVFSDAKIIDKSSGKVAEKLNLKYKYIPEALVARLEDIEANKSSIARIIFYKDGIEMFKDHWLLGAGGGAWSLIYTKYQSYDYISSEPHNFFLQVAVEAGAIGLLVVLALLVSVTLMMLVNVWKKRTEQECLKTEILQSSVFVAIVAIFAHSAIDFDLSMSAVALLLWSLLGIYNSGYRSLFNQEPADSFSKHINKLLDSVSRLLGRVKSLNMPPALIIIISLVIAMLPGSLLVSRHYVKAAAVAQDNRDQNELLKYMDKVVAYNPFNPKYFVDYANLLVHKIGVTSEDISKANELVRQAEKYSKNDAQTLVNMGNYHLYVGNIDKGLAAHKRASELRPYDTALWEFRAETYMQVVLSYFNKNDATNALEKIDEALTLADAAKEANARNLNPFKFTEKTMETIERFAYIKDNILKEESININQIVFYNLAGMDVDRDKMPDQWQLYNGKDASLTVVDNIMTAKALTSDMDVYIQSRMLNFNSSKICRVNVELIDGQSIDEITFSVPGINDEIMHMKKDGNLFTGEFVTPADINPYTAALRIWIKNKEYKIKNISIIEL